MSLLSRITSIRDRPTRRTTWEDRVKRAAAPRKAVQAEAVPIPWIPSPLLIECLVAHGMPRRHANTIRTSKQLYYIATRFSFDVADAESGDAEAKARVDHFRESQERLRNAEKESLGLDPDRAEPVKQGRRTSVIIPRGIDAN